jgi:glyoxylase-like metal-dependent hydrolase (beta-lactamase superfamily II)
MNWQVAAARIGGWDAIPGPELYWMSSWGHWEDMALLSIVARAEDGTTAVVNTGPPLDYLDYMNSLWRSVREDCQLRVADDEQIESVLARFDTTPEEVDYVVCTPFQAYTVGNLDKFTKATICLSGCGWRFFFENPYPEHPHDFRPMVFPPLILQYLIYDAHDRIRLLDDEDEILPGFSTFFTGTHHRASIAVQFETAKGAVVVSDAAFQFANVEEGKLLGINENMYEALEAYRRFRKADLFIPLYEKRVFERYPNGVIA